MKAKINTYYAEYGADYVKEMEHPILSYEWSLDSDYKGGCYSYSGRAQIRLNAQ